MKLLLNLTAAHQALGRFLDHFQSLLLLGTRCYISWQLWISGWPKVLSWGTTSRELEMVTGAGELLFAAMLLVGVFGRVGALGACFVNALALIFYQQAPAGVDQHVLWGFMLLVLTVFGPGGIAVDTWLQRRNAARCRPFSPSVPV